MPASILRYTCETLSDPSLRQLEVMLKSLLGQWSRKKVGFDVQKKGGVTVITIYAV